MFAVAYCVLLMGRFSNMEKKKKSQLPFPFLFLFLFFASLLVTSNSYLTHTTSFMKHGLFTMQCIRRMVPFFCLFINEVLPRQWMCSNHPSFWGSRSPVFYSINGRDPAALKLFDPVSCGETLCVIWHIGTTTKAPLVNNYWSFKLWPLLFPS